MGKRWKEFLKKWILKRVLKRSLKYRFRLADKKKEGLVSENMSEECVYAYSFLKSGYPNQHLPQIQ